MSRPATHKYARKPLTQLQMPWAEGEVVLCLQRVWNKFCQIKNFKNKKHNLQTLFMPSCHQRQQMASMQKWQAEWLFNCKFHSQSQFSVLHCAIIRSIRRYLCASWRVLFFPPRLECPFPDICIIAFDSSHGIRLKWVISECRRVDSHSYYKSIRICPAF